MGGFTSHAVEGAGCMPAGYLSRSWSLCRTGNLNLLQVLTNVLSCEGVYISVFLCSEQFLQDLIFLFCKIQLFMVAKRSFLPRMAWGGRWLLASCREAGIEILISACKARVTWVERGRQWFTCGSVPGSPALHTSKHSLKQIISPGCQSWDLVISKWAPCESVWCRSLWQ